MQEGEPRYGTYRGRIPDTDLALRERGVSRVCGCVSEKSWQWFAAFDEDVAVGGAVVDAGFFATAFLWVFDRRRGELVFDDSAVVPPQLVSVSSKPTDGEVAASRLPRRRLTMNRTDDVLFVEAAFAGCTVSLEFTVTDEAAVTAVASVAGREGGVNVTEKEAGCRVSGSVDVTGGLFGGGDSYSVDGEGFLDYSHGLHGRETSWRWAFAGLETEDGDSAAFNLVEGWNDGLENLVWLDGEIRTVEAAELDCSDRLWRVTTDCGTVDAALDVEGVRRHSVDIGVVSSKYTQPLGQWHGEVAGHEVEGVGVAEIHRTCW